MTRVFALERRVAFLDEQRREAYKWYGERVAQVKMLVGAKNDLQSRTLSGLERHGA